MRRRNVGCAARDSSVKPVLGKPVQFPGALGLDIPFSSLFTQLRYEKNIRIVGLMDHSLCLIPVGWGFSWRIVRKVRTDQTFRGSGCRGGLGGRVHHISLVRANRFPSFCIWDSGISSSFSLSTTKKSAKIPPGYWWHAVQAHPEVRKSSGKRWLRFFSGKRILRDMLFPKSSGNGTLTSKFADALVLRSLRAVPGVWRLSWSFRTRNPQRTHTQLYGAMCGVLECIHQVRAPPTQWAASEVPLRAAVRNGDVLLAGDREANKAWCVDRQDLLLYLTSQLLQDKHTWKFRPGLQERDVCALLLTKSVIGLPDWIRAGYKGVGDVRPACLFSTGQIQVFPGLWGSSVLQSWALLSEKCDWLLFGSSQDGLAQYHALADRDAKFLTFHS